MATNAGIEDAKEPNSTSKAQAAGVTGYTSSSSSSISEGIQIRTAGDGAFDSTEDPRYYKPIPTYEGYHRWDPYFEWKEEEEKRIVRKVCVRQCCKLKLTGQIDLRVCTFACVTFFALQLDRGNIVQALSDNMLDDLGMITNDYNTGQTIFLVCFLFAEMPSQLISKWIGPDRWIPIQMVSWSLVAAFQAFVQNKGGYFACRALLGLIEGGL